MPPTSHVVHITLVLFTLAGCAPKPDPLTFDLYCKGTDASGSKEVLKIPWHETYALDLHQMIFCRGKCTDIEKVASLTNAEITFAEPARNASETINRYSGEYRLIWNMDLGTPMTIETTADCTRRPYTGMPGKKF